MFSIGRLACRAGLLLVWLVAAAMAETSPVFSPERDASFLKFVNEHIQRNQARGLMRIYDPVLQKTWDLKLVGLRKETLAHHGTQGFGICAEFKSTGGGRDSIDVDFDADWEDTLWDMEKVTLHKVNGEVRTRR